MEDLQKQLTAVSETVEKLITAERESHTKELATLEQKWSRKYAKLEQKLVAVRQVEKEKAERRLAKKLAAASKLLGSVSINETQIGE